MSGRVYLVGAGPGHPGLLTVRGHELLSRADVVVTDHLVPRQMLAVVRPDAVVIGAGRPHGDGARLDQREIERLLIEHAKAGRMVVRLKNGDPMLFGRGAEEGAALTAAGVPFEIVPGVTSALAVPAYAGIPLTHRDHASLVTIATGHQRADAGGDARLPALPWAQLATQGGTLVFLMAMRELAPLLDTLVRHGLPADRPAAAVQHGTRARQRTIVATAGTLAARVAAEGLEAPAVVVVGDVVSLRREVAWAERRPLAGRRIVVTRPREQAAALADRLEALGAEVLAVPTIVLEPPDDPARFDRAVAGAASYDWIVFTSVNGVRAFFDRFAARGRDVRTLGPVKLAAIGSETARVLHAMLLRPALVPAEYRAEALVEAFAGESIEGLRVLLPRAAEARPVLPDELRRLGAVVDDVSAYRTRPPTSAEAEVLLRAFDADHLDVVTFTSSSTVRNFAALVGADRLAAMQAGGRPLVACLGPVTADTAREHGLATAVQPATYTTEALATALVEHFCKAGTDPVAS